MWRRKPGNSVATAIMRKKMQTEAAQVFRENGRKQRKMAYMEAMKGDRSRGRPRQHR